MIAPGQTATIDVATPLNKWSTYTYRVRTYDGVEWSDWSASCELQVDNPPDNAPEVSYSAAFEWGKPTPVTFRPGTSADGSNVDTGEVYMYKYGFSQDRLSMSVLAGADGSATVPVTPWSTNDSTLYVRAYNHSGQTGPDTEDIGVVDLFLPETNPPAGPSTRKAGDTNGDGAGDVTVVNDLGGGMTQVVDLTTRPGTGALYDPRLLVDTDTYPAATTKWVRGDFDGDGRTDLASFRNKGASAVTLQVLRSDGNALADTQVWDSTGVRTWQVAKMQVLAANFDGDAAGRDDIAVVSDLGASTWRVDVLVANGSPSTVFNAPQFWYANPAGWSDFNRTKWVAGKFVGNDNFADIASMYNYDNCQTKLWLQQAQPSMADGQRFTQGVMKWDGGLNNWCWGSSTFVAGDYSGDGRADILGTYTYGGCATSIWAWTPASDGTFPVPRIWQSLGGTQYWCGDVVQTQMTDLDGDGDLDVVLVYGCCGPFQRKVYTLEATGGALSAPVLRWEGALGRPGMGNVRFGPATRYQLVARHSSMCLATPSGSTADSVQLVQETCAAGVLSQQFTVERRGGGYVSLRPAQVVGKCIDIRTSGTTDGVPAQQYTCNNTAAQSFSAEYVRGFTAAPGVASGNDVQVRLVNNNSQRCLEVASSSSASGALVQQWTCHGGNNQNFYVRPVFDTAGLQDAGWSMNEAGGTTLADDTGRGAKATLAGSATVGGGAATFNGTSAVATTTFPVVNPTRSFTVSAWVHPSVVDANWRSVLSQDGERVSSFALQYDPNGGLWDIVLFRTDANGPASFRARSTTTAQAGVWTHLTGVYDQDAKQLRIYVNGVLEATVFALFDSWSSNGGFVIGRTKYDGVLKDFFAGDIDDVRVYGYALTDSDIAALAGGRA
jgi:hypothetical protein